MPLGGGLLIPESQVIASLMLTGVHENLARWQKAIRDDNVLQKRSWHSADRMAGLIRNRLLLLDADGWRLISRGSREVRVQMVLGSALLHSRLLRDFLTEIVWPKHRRFEKTLGISDWTVFFAECVHRDPNLAELSPSTVRKLREVAFRVLVEGGLVPSTRDLQVSPITLAPSVAAYFEARSHRDIVKAIDPMQQVPRRQAPDDPRSPQCSAKSDRSAHHLALVLESPRSRQRGALPHL